MIVKTEIYEVKKKWNSTFMYLYIYIYIYRFRKLYNHTCYFYEKCVCHEINVASEQYEMRKWKKIKTYDNIYDISISQYLQV